jgi:hypothetical protein
VIFAAGFILSYQKDQNDRANQQHEQETGLLRLATSANEADRKLAVQIIALEKKKLSLELIGALTVAAEDLRANRQHRKHRLYWRLSHKKTRALKADRESDSHCYIQIARDDQVQMQATFRQISNLRVSPCQVSNY